MYQLGLIKSCNLKPIKIILLYKKILKSGMFISFKKIYWLQQIQLCQHLGDINCAQRESCAQIPGCQYYPSVQE